MKTIDSPSSGWSLVLPVVNLAGLVTLEFVPISIPSFQWTPADWSILQSARSDLVIPEAHLQPLQIRRTCFVLFSVCSIRMAQVNGISATPFDGVC